MDNDKRMDTMYVLIIFVLLSTTKVIDVIMDENIRMYLYPTLFPSFIDR